MEVTLMAPPTNDHSRAGDQARDALAVSPRRALVIDDDPRSASHFKETLDRMGVQAQTARTIGDGVGLAASGPTGPPSSRASCCRLRAPVRSTSRRATRTR